MDLSTEKQRPQKVQVVNPIELELDSDKPLIVDLDPESPYHYGAVNSRKLNVFQTDPYLSESIFVTPKTSAYNVYVDSVVVRWTDSNQYTHTEIYPCNISHYDVPDVNTGVNINSLMGSYKGQIESILSTGQTYTILFNYHTINQEGSITHNYYSQTFTKQ